ncbi:TRAP transporter substrate-binding protein [Gelidibacter mesophilus]|uniref:TRAP transporter substrate-binding protein n=1 Tax=Gelidibacter mesophilus TaxID=169050 RepID=UPI00040F2E20|nr:TRAP transporter substrate-binding protein [Gelidibacter mesophilus]
MKKWQFIGIIVLNLSFWSCIKTTDSKAVKLAHGLDVNHSVHKAMLHMAEDLQQISGGKMTLKIYPNQQLGSERECLELLQIGSLEMTKVSVGTLENFAPKMKIFGLPFLFKNKQHAFNVLDGPIGDELLNDAEKYWLKGLCYYDAGSRSFYTKNKPIETPKDLKGLKIRVMESVTAMNMVQELGGSPTPISWGELYTSLQQGVVDGAENNPPSFYLSKHYEVCKYYSLDEHTMLPDVLLIGTYFWNSLTEQEQKWLQKAANQSVPYQRKLWENAENEALVALKEAGVAISFPNKTAFIEKVSGVLEPYKNDAIMYDLIQKIRNTK